LSLSLLVCFLLYSVSRQFLRNYYYVDFQSVNVAANAVGEYTFSWIIPDVAGTYMVETGLVPSQLTAYDTAWLKVT
jgi:hypothetical protein